MSSQNQDQKHADELDDLLNQALEAQAPIAAEDRSIDTIKSPSATEEPLERGQDQPIESTVEASPKSFGLTKTQLKMGVATVVLGAVALAIWPAASPLLTSQSPLKPTPAQGQPEGVAIPGPSATPTIDLAMPGGPASADQQLVLDDVQRQAATLPVSEQVCTSMKLSGWDRAACQIEGQQRYFQCTEGNGRKWNSSLAGCELASNAAGKFNQGSIAGLENTLVMNKVTSLVLAGAQDSVIAYALHEHIVADINKARSRKGGTVYYGGAISLAPYLLSAAEKVDLASGRRLFETVRPRRLECIPMTSAQPNPASSDGFAGYDLLTIGCDETLSIPLAHVGDKRVTGPDTYITFIRVSVEQLKSDVRKATRFALVLNAGDLEGETDFKRSLQKQQTRGAFADVDGRAPFGTTVPFVGFSGELFNTTEESRNINMDPQGNWQHCENSTDIPGASFHWMGSKLSLGDQRHQASLVAGDTQKVCYRFAGMAGTGIPRALILRDATQLTKGDIDLSLVMLFDKPKAIEANEVQSESLRATIKTVQVTPAGYQLVDRRTNKLLSQSVMGPDEKGVFLKLAPKRCLSEMNRINGTASVESNKRLCQMDRVDEAVKLGQYKTADEASAAVQAELINR